MTTTTLRPSPAGTGIPGKLSAAVRAASATYGA